jgi:hypothetical protein
MIAKRIWLALITAAVMALSTPDLRAQATENKTTQEETAEQETPQAEGSFNRSARHKNAIVGSWLATVTIPNGPPPFKALFTFTEDGNVVSPAQGGVQGATVFTAAHGSWSHLRGRTFAFTAISIVYSSANGNLVGLFKLRGTVTLEGWGNEWSGPLKNELFNPAGNLVFGAEAAAQAERIKVEPLP